MAGQGGFFYFTQKQTRCGRKQKTGLFTLGTNPFFSIPANPFPRLFTGRGTWYTVYNSLGAQTPGRKGQFIVKYGIFYKDPNRRTCKRQWLRLTAALGLALVTLTGCALPPAAPQIPAALPTATPIPVVTPAPTPEPTPDPALALAEVRTAAEEVYTYCYPALLAWVEWTENAGASFVHSRSLADHTIVPRYPGQQPSTDTLQSVAYGDLGASAYALTLPAMENTWWSAAIYSLWGKEEALLSQPTGTRKETRLLLLPQGAAVPEDKKDWKVVELPQGIHRIVISLKAASADEAARANLLQDEMTFKALGEGQTPAAASLKGEEAYQAIRTILAGTQDLPETILAQGTLLGLEGEKQLTAEEQEAVYSAFESARLAIEGSSTSSDGWTLVTYDPYGDPGARAQTAGYAMGRIPGTLVWRSMPYDNEGTYTFTFTKENLPPAQGFYSMTVCREEDGKLVKGEADLNVLRSGEGLVFEKDGALVVTLSKEAPKNAKNWLALPEEGKWYMILRVYTPAEGAAGYQPPQPMSVGGAAEQTE